MAMMELIVEAEGLAEVEAFSINEGTTGREIVAVVAVKAGFPAEEALLFVEDCESPLDLELLVNAESIGTIHHVHRVRHIEVSVFYQQRRIEKRFSPATRIQRVLDWAVSSEGFNIEKTIAPEMELALHGSTTALPKNAHIGRYLRHPQHCLGFDLIRGVVPNGASL